MTIDQIRPDPRACYRHRATGRLARVRRWPGGHEQAVMLADDAGLEWWGDREDFWREWIHGALYDPARN